MGFDNMQTVDSVKTSLPVLPSAPKFDAGIDYELFLDCVHCGLCTSACPTYVELGDENDSPRGRIYLMRGVTDGRIELDDRVKGHLDLCLDCRACESACPSGVQYGKLIEPFRIHLAKIGAAKENLGWLSRLLLFGLTPYAGRMRWALKPAKLMQWTGTLWLLERIGLFKIMPGPCATCTLCCRRSENTTGCPTCCPPKAPGVPAWRYSQGARPMRFSRKPTTPRHACYRRTAATS
jgi:glycolate oxidase iron-sulfur subunit